MCLFEPKDPITQSALQKYNDISPAAVTSGMFVGLDQKTVFVPNQGPIGKMLHINKEELKLDFKVSFFFKKNSALSFVLFLWVRA